MKLKIEFSLFLLLFVKFVFAQTPDTIIVYEYVYVTDTVWVEKPQKRTDTIPIALLNTPKTKIRCDVPATILENYVYNVRTSNQDKMVKKSFLITLLVGINTFLFSENRFSIKAGGNLMFLEHNTSAISLSPWEGAHLELNYCRPIKSSNFHWSTGAIAEYAEHSSNFDAKENFDTSFSEFETIYANQQVNSLLNQLNNGAFTFPYFALSIPLELSFRYHKIAPYFGLELSFTRFGIIDIANWEWNSIDDSFEWEIPFGITYNFNKYIGVEIEGIQSITTKDNNDNQTYSSYYMGNTISEFRTFKLKCSFVYTF